MKKNIPRLMMTAYVLASFFFFLYSFTQVDLNLTLSRVSIWQNVQQKFQHIGYYERPLSTLLYASLLALFFVLYFIAMHLVRKNNLQSNHIWKIIFMVSIILLFSYPAFSYDIFNYMFTAKTVALYHKNPYTVIPLDFNGAEPWVTFMRWTHLPSAYTPLWIMLTIPAYVLGFGYFLWIMWNIKLIIILSYLTSCWGIEKILKMLDPQKATLGLVVFALNPLVIVESIISPHNDMVMMALAMVSIFLYLEHKRLASIVILAASAAMKLMTVFLLPVFFSKWNRSYAVLAMTLAFMAVIFQREVLPWYFLWVMPFIALLPANNKLTILAAGVSSGLLLRYAPYLYLGNWDPPALLLKNIGTLLPILISAISFLRFRKNILKK